MTKRLSSILTFPYKFIVPLIPVVLGIIVNLKIEKDINQGYFIPLNLFFILFFFAVFLPLKNLKKIEYDENNLLISNFINIEKISLKDVIQVKRWLFYFYKISVKSDNHIKKITILSPARERIIRPFGKLDSILEFEKNIKKKNNGSC